jgi:hypothetical protein
VRSERSLTASFLINGLVAPGHDRRVVRSIGEFIGADG